MPRSADHDRRRAQICGGVRAAAHDVGLGSVTIAGTAKAAGVSVGLVQHYYASKDALLVDTLDRVLSDVLHRVEQATAAAEARYARIEHMLGAGIDQLLPLDPLRREEAYLRLAFAGLALDHAELRDHQNRFATVLHSRAAAAIANAVECGEVPEGTAVDPDLEAWSLVALVDGLCSRLLTDDRAGGEDRARAVIASRMSALFPGDCSHDARPGRSAGPSPEH